MDNLEVIARALNIYGSCTRNDSLDLDGEYIADDMETFAHAVRNPDEYDLDSLLQQVGITTDKDNTYVWMY